MSELIDIKGYLKFDKPLDSDTVALVNGLANTRRMKRDTQKLKDRGFTGDYGVDGEFFCEDTENYGQINTPDVVDYNEPPATQPDLWLQWKLKPLTDEPNSEYVLVWSEFEQFDHYIEWLEYLIDKIFKPRGYSTIGHFIITEDAAEYDEEKDDYDDSTDTTLILVLDNALSIEPLSDLNIVADEITVEIISEQQNEK